MDKRSDLRERVLTLQPTLRVEKLRQRYLDSRNKIVTDVGRLLTRTMKDTEGEALVIRRAKAFASVVRGVPINIYPDELFVGWLWSEPRGSEVIYAEYLRMVNELDSLSEREYTPFLINEEDKKILRDEIAPYWKKYYYSPLLPPEARKLGIKEAAVIPALMHYVVNYEKVLKKGLLSIKEEAEERLAGLDLADPEDVKKVPFLQGVILALEAAAEIGKRFAVKAKDLAEKEEDLERKKELLKISEICQRVPAEPAQSFHEALQSV